jgi:long-chain acyl-CoA synthetase
MLNLATILETSARECPHKTAVVCGDVRWSYVDVNALANRVANGLRAAGVGQGDRVVLACPNLPQFPAIYYGILKAGAVVVPANVMYKRRELGHILNDSGARAFFCLEGTPQLPTAEEGWAAFETASSCGCFCVITTDPDGPSPIGGAVTFSEFVGDQPPTYETVPTNAEDTAVMVYTAAADGRPMGAELTHSNLMANARVARDVTFTVADDTHLVALPLFHMFAQTTQLNAPVLAGATVVLLPRFDPASVLRIMQDEGITFFCGVPTMLRALISYRRAHQFDLDKITQALRFIVSGGEHLTPELLEAFEERFHIPVVEGYGLTEAAPIVAINRFGERCKPGSIGPAVPGTEVRVADSTGRDVRPGEPGELLARGPSVMKGYYNRPEATRRVLRDGWLHTGDLVRMDEDGYLYITGRLKDMVIRGGLNVYPRELEQALMRHALIADAAVVGVPSQRYGEEVVAFVVPESGAALSEGEVLTWVQGEVARYKCPRRVVLQDALPRTETGEVLKDELRSLA